MEQLGDAAVLRDHHIQQVVVVIVEPHGQATAEVGEVEPGPDRAVDQPLVFIHQKLTEIAGAGADHQILVAVVVEIGPGRPMTRRSFLWYELRPPRW